MPFFDPRRLAGDQGEDDGVSLCFTSAPLAQSLEILGSAEVDLDLAIDQLRGEIVVRLCDVGPSGESLLVSRGVLNLAHREGHEGPVDMEPGAFAHVSLLLKAVAHRFPPGNRMRLCVSTTYWPWLWPSPDPAELLLRCGEGSRVALPTFKDVAGPPVVVAEPERVTQDPFEVVRDGTLARTLERDVITGSVTIVHAGDAPVLRLPAAGNLEFGSTSSDTFHIRDGDPLSARVVCLRTATRKRDDWDIRVEATSEMSCSREHFFVTAQVRAFESGVLAFERDWRFAIPRE